MYFPFPPIFSPVFRTVATGPVAAWGACILLTAIFLSMNTGTAVSHEADAVWHGVLIEDATARSGPGESFYETSQLWNGDRVDVYETTADGWCAIRPPIGSFSWVSAQYIEPSTNGVGTVTADGLAARIGSELTDQSQIVAVRMNKGETVLILDRKETPASKSTNGASSIWYKIAPPSGEFRWVRRSSLSSSDSAQSAEIAAPASRPSSELRQVAYTMQNTPPQPAPAANKAAPAAPVANVVPSSPAATPAPSNPPTSTPAVAARSVALPQGSNAVVAEPAAEPTTESVMESAIVSPEDAFQAAFKDLRQESRSVLTRPTEDWVFETLLQRCNELYQIAPSDHDRERVLHLSEALRRTQTIRREITGQRSRSGLAAPNSASLSTASSSLGSSGSASSFRSAPLSTGTSAQPLPGTTMGSNSGLVSLNSPEPVRVVPSQYSSERSFEPLGGTRSSVSNRNQRETNTPTASPVPEPAPQNSQNSSASPFVAPAVSRTPTPAPTPTPTAPTAPTTPQPQTGFDQIGRLGAFIIESESGKAGTPLPAGHPPYGLANEKGELICYLTPDEGVDLSGWINRWVAVNGEPGVYEKNARHLLVRSIAPVEGR